MGDHDHPYSSLPDEAFWRTAVSEPGLFGLSNLWSSKWQLPSDARFATYGSCFAQHISRALRERGRYWVDAEPAPGRTPAKLARRYNYGVYSSRTSNIYTAAQLARWISLAECASRIDEIEFWQDADGVKDSLRPSIEPQGFASAAEAKSCLMTTASAFQRSVADADVFVFTLGLTEGWENRETGQPYQMCPGTVGGKFDPQRHVFRNYAYPEIYQTLDTALSKMKTWNPELRFLLTVSPVPLTATATGAHVLVSTHYSKSTLRAVAGDLAQANDWVDYFPSYEMIATPPVRATFYEPNMRSVAKAGVDFVMGNFFRGIDMTGTPAGELPPEKSDRQLATEHRMEDEELICEELTLEATRET